MIPVKPFATLTLNEAVLPSYVTVTGTSPTLFKAVPSAGAVV